MVSMDSGMNGMVFTDESCYCLQHRDGRIRVWRQRVKRLLMYCVMRRHTSPAPSIMIEFLPWLSFSPDLSPIENVACTTTGPRYTTRCYTRSILETCGSRINCFTPRIYPKFL
ncbi:hypothetical protein TNCV_1660151 [Trichonephila clavipes]|nr:hypothetical protein TNCV_1660151 [Trichonephila clavipes]